MAAKAKLRSVVLFESLDNLKMTVVRFGETALNAHTRIEQSILLKMNIKPTSSKAQQVG